MPEVTYLRLFFQDLLAGGAKLLAEVFVLMQEILGLFLRLFDHSGLFEQTGDVVIVLGKLLLSEAKLDDIIVGQIRLFVGIGRWWFKLRFGIAEAGMDDLQLFVQLVSLSPLFFELQRKTPLVLLSLGETFPQLLLGTLLHVHVVIIFQLPVVVITDTGVGFGLFEVEVFFRIPEEMNREPQDQGAKLADDDLRQTDGQLKSQYHHYLIV